MTGWFRIFVVDRMIKPEIGDIKTKKSHYDFFTLWAERIMVLIFSGADFLGIAQIYLMVLASERIAIVLNELVQLADRRSFCSIGSDMRDLR